MNDQILRLPELLASLLRSIRWRQPPDNLFAQTIPFKSDEFQFLLTEDQIRKESSGSFASIADDPRLASTFYLYRGSKQGHRPLPWLDVEAALLIAVNREMGADVGIALDFRADATNPNVVASAWANDGQREVAPWREVSPTLAVFVRRLQL